MQPSYHQPPGLRVPLIQEVVAVGERVPVPLKAARVDRA
jgi:hypothetical protein